DPCAATETDAVEALLVDRRLAGVQPHANLALDAVGPFVRCEPALRLDRGQSRVTGAGEREEERVSLVVHLAPVVYRDGVAEDLALAREQLAVPLSQLAHELRRALDVGEQHRHRPPGRGRHRTQNWSINRPQAGCHSKLCVRSESTMYRP